MKILTRFMGLYCTVFLLCMADLYAQEGFLRVTSVPDGVAVEIGGNNMGKTPLLTTVKPGGYVLKATLAGYETATENITVLENEVTLVQLTMQKRTQKTIFRKTVSGNGNLTVITDWQDVTIYLDGSKFKGNPPITIKDIPAGLHSVILVSGDYADSSRVLIQKGKTFVLKKSFEEDRAKMTSQTQKDEAAALAKKAEELELKRQALPAKIVLSLTIPSAATAQQDSSVSLWGESDVIDLSFQYRKTGETAWTLKELNSNTKKEDSFTLEKGSYEIKFVATHSREPKGVINIFLGAKKEKIKEYKESFKQDFLPDVQYTYVITCDSKTEFSYKLTEVKLDTPIE